MIPVVSKDMYDSYKEQLVLYKKKTPTKAVRMVGLFQTVTRHGMVKCEDGYLAFDDQGYPYPIAKDELDEIYEIAK